MTHKRCVLQRVSLGALTDFTVGFGMRQGIIGVKLTFFLLTVSLICLSASSKLITTKLSTRKFKFTPILLFHRSIGLFIHFIYSFQSIHSNINIKKNTNKARLEDRECFKKQNLSILPLHVALHQIPLKCTS